MFQPGGVAQARQEEGEFLFPIFEHRTEQGSAKFELHEESEGTQRLFSLAAPVLDVYIAPMGEAQNAAALQDLLAGAVGPYRDIVLLNAAAALLVAETVETLHDGVEMAGGVIDDGRAQRTLDALTAASNAEVAPA